jgi:hypothetical protein
MSIALTSSLDLSIKQVATGVQGQAAVNISVDDDRPFLSAKTVTVTVNWGDGSPPSVTLRQLVPWTAILTHVYTPGTYMLLVSVQNYNVPTPDTARNSYAVAVNNLQSVTVNADQPIIYGPILPREGFPNTDQWNWNFSQDTILLESSARLLLLTDVGERLMNPAYGTDIRRLLFTSSDTVLQDVITQEIRRAFSVNEPRVAVTAVTVQGIDDRQISITVRLASNLDQRAFQVATVVTR